MPKELRFNPLLKEWVIYADNREERPLFPQKCPFCDLAEAPVALDNRYPSLAEDEPKVSLRGREAEGKCEVIVFSKDHNTKLSSMPINEVKKVVDLWKERYRALSKRYRTVFIFENRGKEIGVTMDHPHGQIYAMDFYPPVIRQERSAYREHLRKKGRCIFCDIIGQESGEKNRIVMENDAFIAFIPYFARWSFETHIYPKEHVSNILGVDSLKLAETLVSVLKKIEKLGSAYILCFHQSRDDFHFHAEIYPPYASVGRVKYRGGVETGAGTFINSLFPEESAEILRDL
ncbi:MAG: galactose-1-phosphate uridylyltransferase [Candidatus Thermoplasmatota archaeon]|nr:galactose-1-phosphate uridylyltransferase [Candidatus Thermoplasmatota archaeon]